MYYNHADISVYRLFPEVTDITEDYRHSKDTIPSSPPPHGHRHARPFQRGDFKYILLQHLKEKASYGYEIIRALEERFHNFYTPSPGSVYPTLQMLEEMGYVTSGEEDGKKVYSITPNGLQFLEEQSESGERIADQMKKWYNPENADDVVLTMHEFKKLAGTVRDKVRSADTERLKSMRKILSQAYEDISKDYGTGALKIIQMFALRQVQGERISSLSVLTGIYAVTYQPRPVGQNCMLMVL